MTPRQHRRLDPALYLVTHRDLILESYHDALRMGADGPTVLLLDLGDDAAMALAATSGRDDEVAFIVAEGRRHGRAPLMFFGMPRALAVELISDISPNGAAIVAVPLGDDAYYLIVVAGGSVSVGMIPVG
jgi:hypothetical protein